MEEAVGTGAGCWGGKYKYVHRQPLENKKLKFKFKNMLIHHFMNPILQGEWAVALNQCFPSIRPVSVCLRRYYRPPVSPYWEVRGELVWGQAQGLGQQQVSLLHCLRFRNSWQRRIG
eukprot:TRINITY_DN28340_c0_g1_i2.p3 TRINITY_DN28340_c0_g1~~TRINITY_DN28340_c0_g1_i2.p3  ORF type:complete len:126 (+),score=13.44 TRINITY_DN28340_c0_g1_i2:30-380(+)